MVNDRSFTRKGRRVTKTISLLKQGFWVVIRQPNRRLLSGKQRASVWLSYDYPTLKTLEGLAAATVLVGAWDTGRGGAWVGRAR